MHHVEKINDWKLIRWGGLCQVEALLFLGHH